MKSASDSLAWEMPETTHRYGAWLRLYEEDRMQAVRVRLAVLLLAAGAAAGCGGGATESPGPLVWDSAGVLVQEFPADVLERPAPIALAEAPDVRIGVVQGAPEYQWTRPVAAARLSDSGFVVLEQVPAEVRVFDASGRFVRRIGSEGDGPGEFRSPVGLAVLAGDTIVVWDRGLQRVSWFSREGSLDQELTLRQPGGLRSVRHVALSLDGAVVALGSTTTEVEIANQGRVRERWALVRVQPANDSSFALGTMPGTERVVHVQSSGAGDIVSVRVEGRWWWGEGFAWASERGVWTADRLSLQARHFDQERGLDQVVRVAGPDRPFTRALIDSLHQVELERVSDPELRALWRADFEERDYPDGVPPVAAVFSDAAARVWIGLTDPPPGRLPSGGLSAVRRWLVFEGDAAAGRGNPAALRTGGVLTLPPRSHPLWASADGVLLVRNDMQTDVAYVEWYPYVDP